jgi:hypothetical protein
MMSSVLKIKRSSGSSAPGQLAQGELAYSWDEAGGFTLGKLWIGTGSETLGAAANIHVIGGKYFVDMLDHTPGTLTASSALVVDSNSKLGQLKVDNLDLNGNTISALDTDGSITLAPNGTGSVNVSGTKITGLADPVADTDAANKRYVDAARSGLDVKQSVRAATTANITLSGTQTVDGIALAAGERVLVKNQTTASQNGIYDVAAGAWTRSSDADNSPGGEVTSGMFTFVESGTSNANTGFVLTTQNPITLDSTALTFTVFTSAGAITAGLGLSKTGDTLDVNVGGGIEIVSDTVQLASTVAGNGLTLTTGVLAVGAGTGIAIAADTVGLTGQALNLHNQTTTGLFARTSGGSIAARSIAVSGTGIAVADGDASAANPTLSLSAALASIGGLTPAADNFAYFTGATTAALASLTTYARSLLDDVDAAAARTTLGLGSLATQAANNVTITGGSITNLTTLDGVTLDGGTY